MTKLKAYRRTKPLYVLTETQLTQIKEPFSFHLTSAEVSTQYIFFDGFILRTNAGYAWDGASGPAIDTDTIMRATLVHDALYQLIRTGNLLPSSRKAADVEFRKICLEDGMFWFRAWYVYVAVRLFGRWSARLKEAKKECQKIK